MLASWLVLRRCVDVWKGCADAAFQGGERDVVVALCGERVGLDLQEALARGGEREQVDLTEGERAREQAQVFLELRDDVHAVGLRARGGCGELAARECERACQKLHLRGELCPGDLELCPRLGARALVTLKEGQG